MKLNTLVESSAVKKAGVIPFIKTERGIEMMFMRSSDPDYGGPDPMIAKGHVDPGETPEQAAMREGNEELGLLPANCNGVPFTVADQSITGLDSTYIMRVMAVEVKSKDNFGAYHYETAETMWLTVDEYAQKGRKSQLGFVQALAAKLG